MPRHLVPTRRAVLRGASAALALAGCTRAGKAEGADILLLVADDLGRGDIGPYGGASVATPNLDALAARGCTCERMYTPVALCRPARAALYTGCYPVASGVAGFNALREDVATWPELFRAAGCATGVIGKQVEDPKLETFEFRAALEGSASERRDPARCAAAVDDFFAQLGGRRFALNVNFHDPHRDADGAFVGAPLDERDVRIPGFLADTPTIRSDLALYFAAVRRLDAAVGAVLGALERSGRAPNTLVLFTSDNGCDFPFAKTTLYDAGIRMPFIVAGPGVAAPGRRSGALLSFVDVLPTCLELAGAAPPAGCDGHSFARVLRGELDEFQEEVFASHTADVTGAEFPSRAICTPRFKYIRNFATGERFVNRAMRTRSFVSMLEAARTDAALAARIARLVERPPEELYDTDADPCELVDLAADPRHGTTRDALRVRLRAWMERSGDPLLAQWK